MAFASLRALLHGLRRRPVEEPSSAGRAAELERRLHFLEAIALVAEDPAAIFGIVANAADPADAAARLQEAHALDAEQATAITDMQFRRTTRSQRARLLQTREEARGQLADLRRQLDASDA